MSTGWKIAGIAGIIALALLLMGAGYGLAVYRRQSVEKWRNEQIDANNAKITKLEQANAVLDEANKGLRAHAEEVERGYDALKQVIAERGSSIATEVTKLEQINEDLKAKEAATIVSSDRCTRCRDFSAVLIARGRIKQPLPCTDECPNNHK